MRECPKCGAVYAFEAVFCPEDGTRTRASASVAIPDPLLGNMVEGRYRIEERIGEGGMGVVYRATHAVLNRSFALKVLRSQLARDATAVKRFMREAQAASAIGHVHIVDISDFGSLQDGRAYFAMEYLEGRSLTDAIAQGRIGVPRAVHIARQIASALEAAHAQEIVHRDLKPDNVLLLERGDERDFVKVLDFGIAKVGDAAGKLTKTGMVYGTPYYMSPEQAAGKKIDGRTDVYALGVILYEMLTGKVPFEGDTFMGVVTQHLRHTPRPPSELAGHALGAVEQVILRALAKKPDARYASMAEFQTALAQPEVTQPADNQPEISPGEHPPDARDVGPGPEAMARRAASTRGSIRADTETVVLPTTRVSKWLPVAAIGALVMLIVGIASSMGGADGAEPARPGRADQRTDAAAREAGAHPAIGKPGEPSPDKQAEQPAHAANGKPNHPSQDHRRERPKHAHPTPTTSSSTTPAASQLQATLVRPPLSKAIRISSTPSGAQVLVHGSILGNTPHALARPKAGTEVVLRLPGHRDESVRVTRSSPAQIRVAMRPVPRQARPPARHKRRRRPPKRKVGVGEVVDPWAM